MLDPDICPRCVIMHLNLMDDELLRKPEDEIDKVLCERWPSLVTDEKRSEQFGKKEFCHSCLGMLQDAFLNSCIDKITQVVKNEKYICESFRLMVSQPVQLLLFGKNFTNENWTVIKEHRCHGNGIEIKDVMKIYMEHKLEKSMSLKAMSKIPGELEIILAVKHRGTEHFLLPKVEERVPQCFSKAKHHIECASRKKPRNDLTIFNLTTVTKAVETLHSKDLSELIEKSYFSESVYVSKITTLREPIFFAGRYCKYSRELSQTPWILDGERKSDMSVEEFIAIPIKKQMRSDSYNFASSGREDIDVRMLGEGRPFLLELVNARNSVRETDLSSLQEKINQSTRLIQVQDLQVVNKNESKCLKDGEEDKTKSYSAVCYTKLPIETFEESKCQLLEKLKLLSEMKNLEIEQKTPLRVLHRRNLAVRKRLIPSLNAKELSVAEASETVSVPPSIPKEYIFFKLDLTTQAGTYVKEFVHGDFGRTVPNLGTLIGCEDTDILSLDVNAINMDWPPKLS